MMYDHLFYWHTTGFGSTKFLPIEQAAWIWYTWSELSRSKTRRESVRNLKIALPCLWCHVLAPTDKHSVISSPHRELKLPENASELHMTLLFCLLNFTTRFCLSSIILPKLSSPGTDMQIKDSFINCCDTEPGYKSTMFCLPSKSIGVHSRSI